MTDHEVRELVLQHLYENRHTRRDGISVPKIAQSLGLDIELVKSAARQLDDLTLARYERTVGGRGTVSITTYGVTDMEGMGGGSSPITLNQNTFNTSSESGTSNVIVGDGNVNSTKTTNIPVADLLDKLNALDASPEEKEEAKGLVTRLTHNPLICAVVGGAVSGLV